MLWYQRFEGAIIKHLVHVAFDHHPIMLVIPKKRAIEIFGFPLHGSLVPSSRIWGDGREFWRKEPRQIAEVMDSFKKEIWQCFLEKETV